MIFWVIFFGLCAFCTLYHLLTKKYLNPYKLIMVFGKKGAGKSTLQTKLALNYSKKGWTVYCTSHIPCTYYIPEELIGKVELERHSVLLVDEVGMLWDNRDFKSFSKEVRDWFKLQRHRKVKVYLFSQTFDVDKKIRDLVDEMYLINNVLRCFSYAKRINRRITITKATDTNGSTLADELYFDSILFFWCGSRKLTFIPKYAKYFDSYECPKLKDYNFEYLPIKEYTKNGKKLVKLELGKVKENALCSILLRVYRRLIIKIKRVDR